MLVIRPQQLQALQAAMNRRFAVRLFPRIRGGGYELASNSDEELLHAITAAIGRAQSYGLECDRDVTAFVELAFAVGPTFDLHPAFHRVLTDPKLVAAERLTRLFAIATPRDWAEAAGDSDAEM